MSGARKTRERWLRGQGYDTYENCEGTSVNLFYSVPETLCLTSPARGGSGKDHSLRPSAFGEISKLLHIVVHRYGRRSKQGNFEQRLEKPRNRMAPGRRRAKWEGGKDSQKYASPVAGGEETRSPA